MVDGLDHMTKKIYTRAMHSKSILDYENFVQLGLNEAIIGNIFGHILKHITL